MYYPDIFLTTKEYKIQYLLFRYFGYVWKKTPTKHITTMYVDFKVLSIYFEQYFKMQL